MSMEAVEAEVRQRLATGPHYPLGEPDAMKWAIAFRVLMEKNGVPQTAAEWDSRMVGWFANCMASQEMIDSGGSFLNADGMQAILDGEMKAHPEFRR